MQHRGWAVPVVCAAIVAIALGVGRAADARGKDDKASQAESAIRDDANTTSPQAASSQDAPLTFEKSPAWSKVDPQLQTAWKGAMTSGNTSQRFDAFVRCQQAIDQGDQSFLISNGFIVRAASGPIASGHLKASDLPSVAALPFVSSIKLSTKP